MKFWAPLLILPLTLFAKTHVIYVSALIEDQYEWRKGEYLESLEALKSYDIEPWIIEAMDIQESFFDTLVSNVLYPNVNDISLRNQGVNEAMSIIACLDKLPFDDDDIVIKLTGRYLLYRNTFLNDILEHPECDAFVKWINTPKQAFTGIFAMRWKEMKEMFLSWDLTKMEREMTNFERMVGDYIQNKQLATFTPNTLFLKARIYGKGKNKEVFLY